MILEILLRGIFFGIGFLFVIIVISGIYVYLTRIKNVDEKILDYLQEPDIQEATGYQIRKAIEEREESKHGFIALSTIYASLAKLQRDAKIQCRVVHTGNPNTPLRRLYRAAGKPYTTELPE